MGMFDSIGSSVATTPVNVGHWAKETWNKGANWIDSKIPEVKVDHKSDINVDVQLNKENFNVRVDTDDVKKAVEYAASTIADSARSIGSDIRGGLGEIADKLSDSIRSGLFEIGRDIVTASVNFNMGLTFMGNALMRSTADVSKTLSSAFVQFDRTVQGSVMAMAEAIERLDVTGGMGRYIASLLTNSQIGSLKLSMLEHYFSRVKGEHSSYSFMLRMSSSSARAFPGFKIKSIALVTLSAGRYNEPLIVPFILEGDKTEVGLYDINVPAKMRLGTVATLSGIPVISAIINEIPINNNTKPVEKLADLCVATDGRTNASRREILSQLSSFGPYVFPHLGKLRKFFVDDSVTNQVDEFTQNVFTSLEQDVKTYMPTITGTILNVCNDYVEPVSLLTTNLFHLDDSATFKAKLVANDRRVKTPKQVHLPLAMEKGIIARDFGSKEGIDVSSIPVTQLAAQASQPAWMNITTYNDVLKIIRYIIKLMKEQVRPEYSNYNTSIYGLVRDTVDPFLQQQKEILGYYEYLTRNNLVTKPFEIYDDGSVLDPILTHLLRVRIMTDLGSSVITEVDVAVTDVLTGVQIGTDSYVQIIDAVEGEGVIPIPLRFINDTRKYDVTIDVRLRGYQNYELFLSHFCGLLTQFNIHKQVFGRQLKFTIQRPKFS